MDPEERRASSALATLAVASLVVGILGLLLAPFVVGGVLGLVGLTLGIAHLSLGGPRRALAAWGLSFSTLAVVVGAGASLFYYRHLTRRWRQAAHVERPRSYEETVKSWEGRPAPPLSLPTVDGATFNTTALVGHPVVLNFWATWCKACVAEIPDLNRLSSEFTVVGISNESPDVLREFKQTHPMGYSVVSAEDLPAPFDEIPALPTTVFIGRDGVIHKAVVGTRDYEALKRAVLSSEPVSRAEAAPR
jgi:peroxiredoxin